MKSGLKVPKLSHKDYDFIPSFGGISSVPVFPPEYNTDNGLGMPDQNADGQPYGCTNYDTASLSTDLTGVPRDTKTIEAVTHANASGGYNVRDSLDAGRGLNWFKWYFNIQAYAPLDWFDTLRYAQLMGVPAGELRSIAVGTPWFPSWEQHALAGLSIMPMPTPEELATVAVNPGAYPWHAHKLAGWKQIAGQTMFTDKSWQGRRVGDGGWLYFPREVINVVMSLKFTVAYTPTMLAPTTIQRISLPLFDTLMSYIRNFALSLHY